MADTLDLPPGLDPLIGQRLGDFQVLDVIGQGGQGIVYGGIQPVIKKRVAIKVLRPEYASDAGLVKRLVAEAEAVNSINHRNIIDIFGMGQLPDGRTYIVMEFLEGQPLDAKLRASAPLPPHEALEVLIDICTPLVAAHTAGVIHRDLKPSNVFLVRQKDGTRFLKLLDFGLAKQEPALDGHSPVTSINAISGTPAYMSPEQCKGAAVSPRTDLYALGVMGFELLTGRLPFTAATPIEMMMAQVGSVPQPPSAFSPRVPPELDRLILRLLEKAPEARPASAEEVRAELRRIAAVPVSLSVPVAPPAPAPAPLPAPRARWPIAVGAAFLLAVGVLAWLGGRERPALPAPTVPAGAPPPPAAVAAPLPALPPPAPEPAPAPAEAAPVTSRKPPPRKADAAAPSAEELTQQVERLAQRLRRATPAGATPDPSALGFLERQKLAISVSSTPADRQEISATLKKWEKRFLRK